MPHTQSTSPQPEEQSIETIDDVLQKIAREGARSLLQRALEAEIADHLDRYSDLLTEDDRKTVVRNGSAPERTILTGVGPVRVQRPRVDEREAVKRNPQHKRFTSSVLPRFLRRTPSIEGVVATLYLKGDQHQRFRRGVTGDLRRGCRQSLSEHREPSQGRMARGIRTVAQGDALQQSIRVHLGRWRVFQRPN
jgi:hypothetical protein